MAIQKARRPIFIESDMDSKIRMQESERALDEKIKAKLRDDKQEFMLGLNANIANRGIKSDEPKIER